MATLIKPGLILTRRVGAVIMIELPEDLGGETLYVSCIQVDRNQTKIGIQCPKNWNIVRGELRDVAVQPELTRPHKR